MPLQNWGDIYSFRWYVSKNGVNIDPGDKQSCSFKRYIVKGISACTAFLTVARQVAPVKILLLCNKNTRMLPDFAFGLWSGRLWHIPCQENVRKISKRAVQKENSRVYIQILYLTTRNKSKIWPLWGPFPGSGHSSILVKKSILHMFWTLHKLKSFPGRKDQEAISLCNKGTSKPIN